MGKKIGTAHEKDRMAFIALSLFKAVPKRYTTGSDSKNWSAAIADAQALRAACRKFFDATNVVQKQRQQFVNNALSLIRSTPERYITGSDPANWDAVIADIQVLHAACEQEISQIEAQKKNVTK